MTPRPRWIAALVAAAVVAYVLYRLFVHSSNLLQPAVITPQMDARRMLSPSLGARIYRLLHERNDAGRSGRPKLIALSFDDGPYPVTTPLLLHELHALHVPATFFLIGHDALQWPEITRRIAADGDEIANHTMTHPAYFDREPPAKVREEILRGRDALWSLVHDPGVRRLFRPPHGRYSMQTIRAAQQLDYTTVLWNDDSGDWRTVGPQTLAAHLEAHATAPEIVLLHSGKVATIEMLPAVVARFRAAGYRFVTVGQMLARVPVEQINHPAKHSV